jgi:hypothetical protein
VDQPGVRRCANFIPLLHWEEGLGEEVAAVFESGGYLLSLSLSSHGGEGTRVHAPRALAGSAWIAKAATP